MTVYTEDIQTALELIEEFGRVVTVQKLNTAPADPQKPWEGQGAQVVEDSQEAPGVFVPAAGSNFGRNVISEENLKRAEQVCLMGQTPTLVEDFDAILDEDGTLWSINWIEVLKPGSEIVLYLFGVTR